MAETPMFGTYCRLGVSIWASRRTVLRAASRKIKKAHRYSQDPKIKAERRKFYGWMLTHHTREWRLATLHRL